MLEFPRFTPLGIGLSQRSLVDRKRSSVPDDSTSLNDPPKVCSCSYRSIDGLTDDEPLVAVIEAQKRSVNCGSDCWAIGKLGLNESCTSSTAAAFSFAKASWDESWNPWSLGILSKVVLYIESSDVVLSLSHWSSSSSMRELGSTSICGPFWIPAILLLSIEMSVLFPPRYEARIL